MPSPSPSRAASFISNQRGSNKAAKAFRDLGLAFAAVLILIYGLVVGWFESFVTPLIIMVAIPFSLVGIILGYWAMGHRVSWS